MPLMLFHTTEMTSVQQEALQQRLGGPLSQREGHWRMAVEKRPDAAELAALREEYPFDINPVPEGFDPAAVGLFISDMDSTLISIECIDEVADFAGRKAEVARVTEAAMRGEIGFEESLTQRVQALTGLDESALEQVYAERLRLNPGGEALLAGCDERDIPTAVVSGGFTYFTDRLQRDFGINYAEANVLEIDDGRLSGRVLGTIVGAEKKRDFLQGLCRKLGITPDQAIAAGDGANDLLMLEQAGIGVAYRAKPKVQAQCDVVLNHSGLDAILHFLEI